MRLKKEIEEHRAAVGIVGMGYVGLPLAMAAAEAGFTVVGLEKDAEKRGRLAQGEVLYEGLDGDKLDRLLALGKLRVSGEARDLLPCEIICVCVPTPLFKTRNPDLSCVIEASQTIEMVLHKGIRPKLVIIESTSYPGTTREVVQPLLEAGGLKPCTDFHLAYSPERVDPGNLRWNINNTPKVLGGMNDCCTELAEAFYRCFVEEMVQVSSLEVAEMTKIMENIFRAVNIALVNELWMLCDRMGIDIWEVIGAAATKPYGFMPFWPGPGLGGHCIPVDPFYLSWKAREYDFQTEFIELAGKVNMNMPYFVAGLVVREMNRVGKTLKGSRLMIVGVAYKPDVGDTRETPAAKLLELLAEEGAEVCYHDPYVPKFDLKGTTMHCMELNDETLRDCDGVIIITAHSDVNYDLIRECGLPVLDTRNALMKQLHNVIAREPTLNNV